ncbi:MAG: hypothetical protein R3F11_26355 [Verrucomicrobiales bacterium]
MEQAYAASIASRRHSASSRREFARQNSVFSGSAAKLPGWLAAACR